MDIKNSTESNTKKPIEPITNRKQKRLVEKALNSKGKSKEELNNMINIMNIINGFNPNNLPKLKECLLEGDKVKLNVEKIKSHPSWDRYQQEYKEFIENNVDVIFTVEYDKKHMNKPNLIYLKEDTSRQKWLLFDGDLFVLDDKDGKFKEMYMITEEEKKSEQNN